MLRISNCLTKIGRNYNYRNTRKYSKEQSLPESADVVIIGGGSAGCHTLYHLSKKGVKAVLLERSQLTAGTTWHTAGLVWRLRPSDVDIQLLSKSRNMLTELENDTGLDPGWIQNGGIFIAHSKTRLDEYKRLASIGNCLGIENHVLSPKETAKIFPLLDPNSFVGSLYSPGDGVVDPAMLCSALVKGATKRGAKIIENCPVSEIIVNNSNLENSKKKISGVRTPYGVIKTDTVVNATGVWGRDLVEKHGVHLPLIPMRHAYIVSETIPGVRGLANIRDHDYSVYFRIQGESICMGGYESNPILLDTVPKDFNFSLYELDWSVFDSHIQGAVSICPAFGKYGIKSTVCGPESFTPDHKPLMGPDPTICGLFHNCGFNSAGMMFGGGCGEQISLWITQGKPDLCMFQFDIKRFTPEQNRNIKWMKERSHESYAKNYSMIFPNDQPLAGRDFQKDPLHDDMLGYGAVMQEKQGWERPGFFMPNKNVQVQPYDWYGNYGYVKNNDTTYEKILDGDLKYEFSDHHNLIGEEAKACRNNAVVFNMSYFGKMLLRGPEAKKAAEWLFTADTTKDINKTIYTCALNDRGGVEADVTVTKISSGTGEIHDPQFEGDGFYIVTGGASSYYTFSTLLSEIKLKKFQADLSEVTSELGVISIQGPKSRQILQKITDFELSDTKLPPNYSQTISLRDICNNKSHHVRILRVSFVGELGYELHVPKLYCSDVYKSLMNAGKEDNLINAGYRALYSLSSEKGYHLWGFDLRSDDTPVEANLGFTCRKNGSFRGKELVDIQKKTGVSRRLVYFSLDEQIPVWGLEGVYRNGEPVGHLRRGDYAYTLEKPFGQAYIERKDGNPIDAEFIKSGKYEIDVMGKLYSAKCHLRSPFDPKSHRVLGIYN